MKKAIIALVRGYATAAEYQMLINRNLAIQKFINKDNSIPMILFHEGNIKEDHMNHIRIQSKNDNIVFLNISQRWSGGYEGMCKFHILDMWDFLAGYDVILRIDEDCMITRCDRDVFELLQDNVFLRSVYWGESHSETNATLPQFINRMTGVPIQKFYNNKFPYTNVMLAWPGFFLDNTINHLLKQIAESPLQKANRWGDLPVLGSILNIYAPDSVGALDGMEYHHISHGTTIVCK